jgi:subtilisin family serine protease
MRFASTPDIHRRTALADAGVLLLTPVGNSTFFARVDQRQFDPAAAVMVQFASVTAIPPEIKRHPDMVPGRFPRRARIHAGGPPRVAAYVLFHADASPEEATPILRRHGARVRSQLRSLPAFVIEIPQATLTALVREDAVQWIEPPLPPFDIVNDDNRVATEAEAVQLPPHELSGAGVTVMVYDGGVADADHPDFGDRLTPRDDDSFSNHATHVAGTIGASGFSSEGHFRGMAPAVQIESYGFQRDDPEQVFFYEDPGDLEVDYSHAIHVFGADLANNSLGTNVCRNNFDCDITGDYGVTSSLLDSIVHGSLGVPFTVVWANGNERSASCTRCSILGVHTPEGYHSTAPPACAKNPIAIGATNSNDDSMTSFSSWGPCDDGRLRPDVAAPGCQSDGDHGVTSCCFVDLFTISCDEAEPEQRCCDDADGDGFGYVESCGTSMAAPTVSGILALLLEDYRVQYPTAADPRNATMKVLLAHSAMDVGSVGPDYQNGYGVVRIGSAIDLMRSGAFVEADVDHAGQAVFFVDVFSYEPFQVTVAWDDASGVPNVVAALVNDLDVIVTDPAGTVHHPWTLDPAEPGLPAVQSGADRWNNIEQVTVADPLPGRWRIVVEGFDVPAGPQPFTVAATPRLARDCNGNEIPDPEELADGSATDCTANGILDECEPDCDGNGVADSCEIDEGIVTDCNADGAPDGSACDLFQDCNDNEIHDACEVASGSSSDCNANYVPDECEDCNGTGAADECDIALQISEDCNGSGVPDECELLSGASQDCNENDIPDECENDCNDSGIADECEIELGLSADCNGTGVPDECELASGVELDCNSNGTPDICDIVGAESSDCDDDGVPDDCVIDCNGNGVLDRCDVIFGGHIDDDGNGLPDDCVTVFEVPADFDTIQSAIDAAAPGDVVQLASGTYVGDGNRDLDFGGKDITVQGVGDPADCVIDCEGQGRGFYLHNGEGLSATIRGLTIRNGWAAQGAGILLEGASPRLIDCVIQDNTAMDFGGGIHALDSSLEVIDCHILDNAADFFGGGISVANGAVSIERTVIAGNLVTSSFLAGEGGGLYVFGGQATMRNSLIVANAALYYGGGIYLWDAQASVESCTIAHNSSTSTGGGMSAWAGVDAAIKHSILWENSSSLGAQMHIIGDVSVAASFSILQGGASAVHIQNDSALDVTQVTDVDPQFADAVGSDGDPMTWLDNDYHLVAGSPVIDGGDPVALILSHVLDLDDEPRRQGGIVDLGSDEFVSDCDSNGIADTLDIADGVANDCNGNGARDDCEVASGHADDINGNGIPDACECTFETPPQLDHARMCAGAPYASFVFDRIVVSSGYVDARRATLDGIGMHFGIDAITLIFTEPVVAMDGGPLHAGSFEVMTTAGFAPSVVNVMVDPLDPTRVRVELDSFLPWQEWTTIRAVVQDECGHAIENAGDLGPGHNEPDRVDVGVLPGDVDHNGVVQPADLLHLRRLSTDQASSPCLFPYMSADFERDGDMDSTDLSHFKYAIPAYWDGATLLHDQP